MTQDHFMLWRFTTTDGVLDDILSFNWNGTVFKNGSRFIYDYKNEWITIENHNSIFGKTENLSFNKVTLDYLKQLGFKERTTNRHSQSYEKISVNFQFER